MAAVDDLNVFNRAAQVAGALLHVAAGSHPNYVKKMLNFQSKVLLLIRKSDLNIGKRHRTSPQQLMSCGCGSCVEFTVTVLQFDCFFFMPLPSERRLLSATGGTSTFLNNQIWCVWLHVCVC